MTWNNGNQKEESRYQTILFALIAGAGAGLAVGLLMAPKPGDKLRADIRGAIDEGFDTAKHKADDLKNSAVNLAQRGLKEMQRSKDSVMQRARSVVSSTVDTGASQAHGAVDQTSGAAEAGAKKAHEAIDNMAGAVRADNAA